VITNTKIPLNATLGLELCSHLWAAMLETFSNNF
jgi:hypothetical protein